jgi:methyl-accepting chemotaxis protein
MSRQIIGGLAGLPLRVRILLGNGMLLALVGALAATAASSTDGAARNLIIVLALGALAFGALCTAWLVRGAAGRLREATNAAQRIASGDLTGELDREASGELGELLRAIAELRDLLFKLVGDIRVGTTTVAATASQMNRDNSDLALRTREQSEALREIATTMQEIAATVRRNADSAAQANELVVSAAQGAGRGGEIMGEVVRTMGSISESSRKIADIIGVINGIAFQTNILALNAAVEAARAGEQGRGFAVVASEVRALANRSAEAAREIKALIEDSVGKIDAGASLVDGAGATMAEIVESVQGVAGLMQKSSEESHQQTADVQAASEAVSRIDDMVQRSAQVVQETRATATNLNSTAVALLSAASRFDLGTREYGNADEAVALVKEAVDLFKTRGRAELLAEINRLGKGRFIDRDLYLMAIGIDDAKFCAHGNNPRVLGNGPQSKDVDGKLFVVEMTNVARRSGAGWVDYKWAHPVTNDVMTKSTYIERAGDLAVACGIYPQPG